MKKDIVLYIDAMIMPDKNAAAQRATAICKSLIDIHKKPVVIGLDNDIEQKTPIEDTKKQYSGIDCYAVKYPESITEWLIRMTTIKPFIKIMKIYGIDRIHSIIAMDYEVTALFRLRMFCKNHNIKLIADSVEWYGKSRLPFPMKIAKNLDTNIRMKCLYPKFENMICISSYLKNYFKDKVSNIIVIPGTIDIDDIKWGRVNKYKGNDIFTLGYAGNPGFNFDKERIDWLIESVIELNEEGYRCKLIMAGFDENIIKNEKINLCNNMYYEKRVKHLGIISHIECLDMIALCDFSVIARNDNRITRAGFPTKFSESFGCGTPVITTPSSNVADYIIEGETGILVEKFSKDSLKQAIKQAMQYSKKELMNIHQNLKKNDCLDYRKFSLSLKELLDK
ncbi:MAG: glycosyltransferase [Lachnospiraceae bacterium]